MQYRGRYPTVAMNNHGSSVNTSGINNKGRIAWKACDSILFVYTVAYLIEYPVM